MANLAVWLAALVGPLARKVLLSLGIGWATYEGFNLISNQVRDAVLAHWGQLGGATLQILTLGGANDMIGITLGAIAARGALMAVSRLTKLSS